VWRGDGREHCSMRLGVVLREDEQVLRIAMMNSAS
jgi:hypothetical protein